MRRWTEGTEFELDGLSWRVVKGRKAPGDLRLEHMTTSGWRPTAMALVFMLADFWYENEDLLYPKPKFQGADYLLRAIERAAKNGYQSEVERLEGEKLAKRQREQSQTALRTEAENVRTALLLAAQACCQDPEWHCTGCGVHLSSLYLPCVACGVLV